MKKVKIMLLSLLVLAVVGGALAFNANAKFERSYCTTPPWQDASGQLFCTTNPGSCPLLIEKTTTSGIGQLLCTTTPVGGSCVGVANCTISSKIKTDL